MAETKQAKPKKARSKKASTGSSSKKASSKAKEQAKASKNGAQSTTNGVAPLVEKAKVPLLAGGAAVAGVAGVVLAATHTGGKRKVLGKKRSKLSLPKKNGFKADAHKIGSAVADAAKRADTIGQGVSRIASSVKQVSEGAADASKKD